MNTTEAQPKQSKYDEYRMKAKAFDALIDLIEGDHRLAGYVRIPGRVDAGSGIVQLNTNEQGQKFIYVR